MNNLFVVHTMGKVGSQSIQQAFQAAGHQAIHCHYLCFPSRSGDIAAKTKILSHRGPIFLVTCVRDPVARNLSAYYQNYSEGEPSLEHFLKSYPHRVPLDWFWGDFFDFWGQGVVGFSQEAGTFVQNSLYFGRGDNLLNLILLRMDTINQLPALLQPFGVEVPVPPHSGVRQDKAYKDFLAGIKLPEDYLNEMYNSLYARAFWTTEQLKEFRKKWAR